MTVKEFVEKYKQNTSIETIKGIISCSYLPYAHKCNLCKRIIQATHYTTIDDDTKEFNIDSTAKHMLFCLNIVDKYTNIDIDFNKSVEEYDLLAQENLIENIKSVLPDYELSELYNVLEMTEHDVMTNEYEIHSFISRQTERFGNLLGISLSPILDKMTDVIENLDAKEIANALENTSKRKIVKIFK